MGCRGRLSPCSPPPRSDAAGRKRRERCFPPPQLLSAGEQCSWWGVNHTRPPPAPPPICLRGGEVKAGGFVAGSSVGVTFCCSFSLLCPSPASLWLWEPAGLPLGNGDPSAVGVFLPTGGVGVNQEVGLAW